MSEDFMLEPEGIEFDAKLPLYVRPRLRGLTQSGKDVWGAELCALFKTGEDTVPEDLRMPEVVIPWKAVESCIFSGHGNWTSERRDDTRQRVLATVHGELRVEDENVLLRITLSGRGGRYGEQTGIAVLQISPATLYKHLLVPTFLEEACHDFRLMQAVQLAGGELADGDRLFNSVMRLFTSCRYLSASCLNTQHTGLRESFIRFCDGTSASIDAMVGAKGEPAAVQELIDGYLSNVDGLMTHTAYAQKLAKRRADDEHHVITLEDVRAALQRNARRRRAEAGWHATAPASDRPDESDPLIDQLADSIELDIDGTSSSPALEVDTIDDTGDISLGSDGSVRDPGDNLLDLG